MNEIAELERRIAAALDRIGRGLEQGSAAAAAPAPGTAIPNPEAEAERAAVLTAKDDEIARLSEELAAERDTNAQLSERVRAVKEKQETGVNTLERKLAEMTRQLDTQGLELQRMKKTNIQLRETIRTLREAMQDGLTEPHLVNKSMLAELEALRASRAAEIAEMDEILAGIEPLLGRIPARAASMETPDA
ncbi:hypothetical protein [Acidimangrovimonas sediminis]|uniref:hypothetical protein n=1 Tax=Acidimangrovimonas sediminis TaxID=2056283 RepID=UPI000C803B83|nr:hypothetical protein [Acidimangrovimonas sediminis]